MPADPQAITARILSADGTVCGAGAAVGDVVLTCAHVVNVALGKEQLADARPTEAVKLDLPGSGGRRRCAADIVRWYPPLPPTAPRPTPALVDIAVLSVPNANAAQEGDKHLRIEDDLRGIEFQSFGFPAGYPNGQPASGHIVGRDTGGWWLVDNVANEYFLQLGFSGAPTIGRDGRMLGIVTLVDEGLQRAAIVPSALLLRAWPALARPYKGLMHYDEADARYFCGREAATGEIVERIGACPFVAVVGASGSGKSSVIRAGVLPRLRHSHVIAEMRPHRTPLDNLVTALARLYDPNAKTPAARTAARQTVQQELTHGADGLARLAGDIGGDRRLLLFVDQFEEVFSKDVDDEQRRPVLQCIAGARSPAHVLVGMRSDFMDAVNRVDRLNQAAKEGWVSVLPMTDEELRAAIAGPAEAVGLTVEPALIDAIRSDVRPAGSDGPVPGYLPLFSFALDLLWSRTPIPALDHAGYEAVHRLTGALASHAQATFEALAPEEREVARQLFERLVETRSEGADTRRILLRATILPAHQAVLEHFISARLLTTDRDAADRATVEIAHEALIEHWPKLKEWIEAERDFLRWRDRLAGRIAEWKSVGFDVGGLLSGALLDEARKWAADRCDALTEDEKHFIEASVTHRDAEAIWEKLTHDSGVDDALLDLMTASSAVKLAFASEINCSEHRAARFGDHHIRLVRALTGVNLALRDEVFETVIDKPKEILPAPSIAVARGLLAIGLGTARAASYAVHAIVNAHNLGHLEFIEKHHQVYKQGINYTLIEYLSNHVMREISLKSDPAHAEVLSCKLWAVIYMAKRCDIEINIDAIINEIIFWDNFHAIDKLSKIIEMSLPINLDSKGMRYVERSVFASFRPSNPPSIRHFCRKLLCFSQLMSQDQLARAAEMVLRTAATTTEPQVLQALGPGLAALATHFDQEKAACAGKIIVRIISGTTAIPTLDILCSGMSGILRGLKIDDVEEISMVIVASICEIGLSARYVSQARPLASVLISSLHFLEESHSERVANVILQRIREVQSRSAIQALTAGLGELTWKLDERSVRDIINKMLGIIEGSKNTEIIEEIGKIAPAFFDRLTDLELKSTVDRSLRILNTSVQNRHCSPLSLSIILDAFTNVLSRDQGLCAAAIVNNAIGERRNHFDHQALGIALAAFIPLLDGDEADHAIAFVIRVIGKIRAPTGRQSLGRNLIALAPRLNEEQATAMCESIIELINHSNDASVVYELALALSEFDILCNQNYSGRVVDTIMPTILCTKSAPEGQVLVRKLIALAPLFNNPDLVAMFVNALAWAFSAIDLNETMRINNERVDPSYIILDFFHERFPDELPPSPSFWTVIEFVADRFPEIDLSAPPQLVDLHASSA